jgi:hypothetical protein
MPALAYDALPIGRRLEIEREIYQRIFGQPYTERSIPEDPSPKQQEYLISCIRNAIYTRNDGGVIKPLQVDVIREMAALGKAEPATAPSSIAAKMKEHMRELCAQGKLPHRLEDYFVEAEVNITRNPDGSPLWQKREVFRDQVLALDATPPGSVPARVDGIECRVMLARATGIPRRQIAEKHLKPLGYKHRGDQGSRGYVAFEKTRPDGSTLACHFDFGTWRASVLAIFRYLGPLGRASFGLQYWREQRSIEIATRAVFERTMENVAFVVKELETLT